MTETKNQKGAEKASGALLSIGELAEKIGVPTHVLRYWETRFPQLKPLQRSGRRRYYRPDDVALVSRIYDLLHVQGYTVDGARKALSTRGARKTAVKAEAIAPELTAEQAAAVAKMEAKDQPVASISVSEKPVRAAVPVEKLVGLRDRLEAALN
jgi:DNA-binding transcriptional MerR regulator